MADSETDAATLLVASQFAQTLDFVDTRTLRTNATITDVVAQPHEIAWDPGRRLAYIAHTYRLGGYREGHARAHEISVIDVDRRRIADVIDIAPYYAPHDIEFDPVHDVIVTGVESVDGRNGLVLVDPERRRVVEAIALAAPNAHWLSLSPDGTRAYVTHKEAAHISVVDLIERRQVGEIAAPFGAEEIDRSPDGRFAFAAAPMMSLRVNVAEGRLEKAPLDGAPPPGVLKIDCGRDAVVGRIDFDEYVSALRVAPDGRVLVTEFHFRDPAQPDTPVDGYLNVIDPESMTALARVRCEELPFTIRCHGDRAFVANLRTGSVSVVDLDAYSVVGRLENNVGGPFGGTHGMCVAPAAVT